MCYHNIECIIGMKYYLTIIAIYLIINPITSLASANFNLIDVCINKACFSSRIADNVITRTQGLMNQGFLPEKEALLFIFPQPGKPEFWTKEMNFPIDIIFINENDIIVYLVKNAPPCQTENCQVFKPTRDSIRVLEINGGLSEKYNIGVGQEVFYFIEN